MGNILYCYVASSAMDARIADPESLQDYYWDILSLKDGYLIVGDKQGLNYKHDLSQ